MNRRGPKVMAWETARAWLKVEFEKRGLTECEIGFPGCWRNDTLSFAHSRKRDDPEFDIYEVAVACTAVCHPILEAMSHQAMYNWVMTVIEKHGGVIRPERS